MQDEPNDTLTDPFHARDTFDTGTGRAGIYRLSRLEDAGLTRVAALPYSIRVLLESVLRNCDGYQVTEMMCGIWPAGSPCAGGHRSTLQAGPGRAAGFYRRAGRGRSGRHAERDEAARRRSERINPLVPVDLVIDHSIQVDRFGTPEALAENVAIEFQRNRERYEFLRWGQKAFATSALCRRRWESFTR